MTNHNDGWLICLFFIIFLFILIILLSYTINLVPITGYVTGDANVTVASVVEITLIANSVQFGTVNPGGNKSTTTNNPLPFKLRNDGNVMVNVTIARDNSSSPLFNGTGGGDNTNSFKFKMAAASEGQCALGSCSTITFTPVPGTTPIQFICYMNFTDTCDELETELLINVPSDEPSGTKTELLNFIAYQS